MVKKLKNPDDVVYGWPPSSTSHIGRSQSDKYAFVIAVGDRRQAALVRDCFSLCLYCFSYSSSSLLQLQSLRKCIQIIIPRITLCMALALLLCTYYYSKYVLLSGGLSTTVDTGGRILAICLKFSFSENSTKICAICLMVLMFTM